MDTFRISGHARYQFSDSSLCFLIRGTYKSCRKLKPSALSYFVWKLRFIDMPVIKGKIACSVALFLITACFCFGSMNCGRSLGDSDRQQLYGPPSNVKREPNSDTAVVLSKSDESNENFVVYAGKGTEQIYLGMTRQDLLSQLGKPSSEFTHKVFCSYSEMHWFPPANADGSVEGEGIFAFLRNNRAFELRFGEKYRTQSGIEYGMPLTELRKLISAPIYRLSPSSNTSTNNEDLWFLIENDHGVAYEIGAEFRTEKRQVNAIYVFLPSSDFQPWGCIGENQTLSRIRDL